MIWYDCDSSLDTREWHLRNMNACRFSCTIGTSARTQDNDEGDVRGQWIDQNREAERTFVVLSDASDLYIVVIITDVSVLC